jgi:AcrR family transcriptional regulator
MSAHDTLIAATPVNREHRSRLLQAMAVAAASKGLAVTTISDVVREAGVSKRTFYEHFSSKEACFLTLYRELAAAAVKTLGDALTPEKPWQAQVETALHAYFSHLAAGPGLMRALFVEIHHLGAEGLQVRREVMRQFAEFMLTVVNGGSNLGDGGGRKEPQILTQTMAMAAVGGINELVLEMIEQGQAASVDTLTPAAAEIVRVLAHADIADL